MPALPYHDEAIPPDMRQWNGRREPWLLRPAARLRFRRWAAGDSGSRRRSTGATPVRPDAHSRIQGNEEVWGIQGDYFTAVT